MGRGEEKSDVKGIRRNGERKKGMGRVCLGRGEEKSDGKTIRRNGNRKKREWEGNAWEGERKKVLGKSIRWNGKRKNGMGRVCLGRREEKSDGKVMRWK